ncbi:MAG: hypothetical protein JOY79_09025, partial [Acidobacteriaceae bacterium]|nr:hypothetical protein [Acidobacteriaceae bacterium]
ATTAIPSAGHQTGNGAQRFVASAFTHSGRLLFLGNHTTGTVYSFALDGGTGTPRLVATTTVGTVPPTAMTVSATDAQLYVAEGQDIDGFAINSSGSLAPLNGGAPFMTIPPSAPQGSGPPLTTSVDDIQADLTGNFLYVLTPNELFAFTINQGTGVLAPNPGANLIAPGAPFNRPWGQIDFGNLK